MTYRFELLSDALLDVEETFLWYQAISLQLRDRFYTQLDISLKNIHTNPFTYHSLNRKVRCKKLKGFPYLVIYAVQKDLISVVAVIPERRNPKVWKQRIRDK